jgi:hypothetical protein
MDPMQQTKQVFVDETGRRGRLFSLVTRGACVLVAAYMGLLVAGFLGASWVPSVRLPVVGDIFDVGRGEPLHAQVDDGHADAPVAAPTEAESEPGEAAAESKPPRTGAIAAGASANSSSANRRSSRAAAPPGRNRPAPRSTPASRPVPRATPNHGASSGNPNAGPKPDKTPAPQASPNRGSSGNSENAGPKPKPSKDPSHPANSNGKAQPEPTPTSGS